MRPQPNDLAFFPRATSAGKPYTNIERVRDDYGDDYTITAGEEMCKEMASSVRIVIIMFCLCVFVSVYFQFYVALLLNYIVAPILFSLCRKFFAAP